ncbi:TetR-like C-terminal domain-containing protein [Phytomonospora endophytica]|uniref:AcrR family transcriptional regulator n=1 Tax=Phytomonospora endophytica TaxID=714109 RepID=A0A841G289_9ACTN|nr:TetR-like C-terminal domain-containing protein [Phytomonospora endophytica]MBB6039882.1 AcrR family transcriptional regulator [Phytomonospora endophytica]GIG71048.1 transcriptional regulator [Phytomonospora endophytica]
MPRAGITPDALVAAAADLADEIGFENLTLAALAKRFGVRDASLYTHVRGLADLQERVALLALTEWAESLGAAVEGRSGRDALVAFADAYRAMATGHPGRYAATRFPVSPEAAAATPGVARIIEVCYALLRGYDLDEPAATDAVRLLRSTFHGFSDLEATGGFTADHSLETSWRRAVDALHHTLTDWSRI